MMGELGGPCKYIEPLQGASHPAPIHHRPTMSKTVKVRIAVSVDPAGAWSSAGWSWSGSDSEDFHSYTIDSLEPGENRYWLEAELEVPETKTITAQVNQLPQAD